jgi:pimeloyl-ACP methyl ester carboxylesterase
MSARLKSIDLPGRVRLPYVEQGDASGVPMLLLHGVTDSWHSFETVLPHLPASVHALALTQRGHGDAERPATGYRAADFAGDVLAFLDALGLERVVLVGHSMGATNARRLAIDRPERTLGLVLAAAFATYRDNPVVIDVWRSTVSRLTDPIDPGFVREFQESTLAQPVPPDFLDRIVQESRKVPARVWRATFEAFLEDDAAGDLGRIQAPTLILWGTRDAFCPRRDQDTLLAAIGRSRLVVYEHAGHALHWEEPERFAADLVAFAGSLV